MSLKEYLAMVCDLAEKAQEKGDKEEIKRLFGLAIKTLQEQIDSIG